MNYLISNCLDRVMVYTMSVPLHGSATASNVQMPYRQLSMLVRWTSMVFQVHFVICTHSARSLVAYRFCFSRAASAPFACFVWIACCIDSHLKSEGECNEQWRALSGHVMPNNRTNFFVHHTPLVAVTR